MRIRIDGHPYSAGLAWRLCQSREELDEYRGESGRELGVILRSAGQIVAVGLADADAERPSPPSAAALLALHAVDEAVLAIEQAIGAQGPCWWLCAVHGGVVVPDTDVVLGEYHAVRRLIEDLRQDIEYRLSGTASEEFGGDGQAVLTPARGNPRWLAKASLQPLAGVSAKDFLVLALALLAVLGVGWWVLAPESKPAFVPPIPQVRPDPEEEQRKAALAERQQRLAADLSGFGALALAAHARDAGSNLERSVRYWRLHGKRCDLRQCTLTWRALLAGATPAALASALGVERDRLGHDLRGDQATVGQALEAAAETHAAPDGPLRTPGVLPLVDRCRIANGRGAACTLDTPAPVAINHGELLPAELRYRRGRYTLSAPLGRLGAVLNLFDGAELSPWVRADAIDFNYESLTFHLEGHYVVP